MAKVVQSLDCYRFWVSCRYAQGDISVYLVAKIKASPELDKKIEITNNVTIMPTITCTEYSQREPTVLQETRQYTIKTLNGEPTALSWYEWQKGGTPICNLYEALEGLLV